MLTPLVLLLLVPNAEPTDAEKLFRQMDMKVMKAKTLECVYEWKIEMDNEGAALKGRLLLGEGNKFRSEWTYERGIYPKVKFLYLSDGEKLVAIINGKKEVVADRTAKGEADFLRAKLSRWNLYLPGNPVLLLPASLGNKGREFKIEDDLKVSDFKFGKKEMVGKREAQIVEYKLTVKGKAQMQTVWLDAKTQLPVKRTSKGGHYTVTYSKLTFDGKIDAKQFELPKE
jgi:outer membrane lipoprotein-sorting protein